MNRVVLASMLMLVAGLLAGCEPSIIVQNNTKIGVRTIVTNGGHSTVVSPSPGESSAADAVVGAYRVTVIPDREWIEWATATRAYLNERLANSSQLTGPQLLDVIQRLKDIAVKMQEYEKAGGAGSSCSSSLSEDADGVVVISAGSGGGLVVTCK